MNPARLRGDEDALRQYAATSGGRVVILGFERDPWVAMIRLKIPCPADTTFPRRRYDEVTLRIEPPHDYPDGEPKFMLSPVPFVTNVFESGRVCMGEPRWHRMTALTSAVDRIEKMLVLDPSTTGTTSPANRAAAEWFQMILGTKRIAVPTMKLTKTTPSSSGFKFRPL
jgi:ubiquitin-protein ligase